MKELIDAYQAQRLMLAVLVLAPLVGLAWGLAARRPGRGVVIGALVGVCNFALWTVYNAVTEKLGLDTVVNLLVNLGLFIVLGVVIGAAAGLLAARGQDRHGVRGGVHGGEHDDVAGDRAE